MLGGSSVEGPRRSETARPESAPFTVSWLGNDGARVYREGEGAHEKPLCRAAYR